MSGLKILTRAAALSCAGVYFAASFAFAQAPAKPEFQPEVGQQGKDVVWVPTSMSVVNKMLDLGKVTANDFVMDLGSGDGRTVITAAKRGAKAMGIEYNPDMVALSRREAIKEKVAGSAYFVKADLFEMDFSNATVVTMFLLPSINTRLRPKILEMKPGTRIVSNSFDMGDWTADDSAQVTENCQSYCRVFHWVVPAKVEGAWKIGSDDLKLEQKYQMLTGTLKGQPIGDGKMSGNQINFTAGNVQYTGYVIGKMIEGVTSAGGKQDTWTATQ